MWRNVNKNKIQNYKLVCDCQLMLFFIKFALINLSYVLQSAVI